MGSNDVLPIELIEGQTKLSVDNLLKYYILVFYCPVNFVKLVTRSFYEERCYPM